MSNSKRKPSVPQNLSWEEALGVVNNKEALLTGDVIEIRQAMGFKNVASRFAPTDFYKSLSVDDRNMVRKSGQAKEMHNEQGFKGWWDPSSRSWTENPTPARGVEICRMYLSQGGRCAYSHVPCDITDMQIEHVRPGAGDIPSNWLLVKSNINMNRKRTKLKTWVNKWEKAVAQGREEFIASLKKKQKKNADNNERAEMILAMSEDELRAFTPANAKEWEYVHRAVGTSSLQKKRLLTNGETRSGGSQGNYKEVLNTIAMEYLHGDKELAAQIFRTVRAGADQYVDGKINNDTYASIMCDAIELSNHQWMKYNREKFINKIVKTTYTWPNVK